MCSDGHMPLTRDHTHTTWRARWARPTPIQLKGESSHVPFQQGVWRPDGRSNTHTLTAVSPPGHTSWEPHAPEGHGGHQTSLIRLRGLAGIFASHSGMKLKPQTRKMGNYKCGNQHNPKAHQRNHKGNGKIRRKTQERAMDANFERWISPHKTGL